MLYLSRFAFPDGDDEFEFRRTVRRTCYDSFYPFGVLSAKGLSALEFEPLTLLYGGNGSGKTTAINVIGEALGLQRDAPYNRSNFFERYTALCRFDTRAPIPKDSRIITSDDVFDFMLDMRALNEGVDWRREALFQEYLDDRRGSFRVRSLADYDELKRINQARHHTQSRYVRENMNGNVREQSNGESAFFYFTSRIGEDALYLLDEPENSLSPQRQQELARFIGDSARFYNCQFVIATHSPFLLAMAGAKVYDLDADPARACRWTELTAVRAWRDFFAAHADEFEGGERP